MLHSLRLASLDEMEASACRHFDSRRDISSGPGLHYSRVSKLRVCTGGLFSISPIWGVKGLFRNGALHRPRTRP